MSVRIENAGLHALGVSLLAMVMSLPALAQGKEDLIEEMIVTARKREEPIFSVPVAVNAYSGQQLVQANVHDVIDLQSISPSLVANTTTGEVSDAVIRIRGIGTTGNNPGLEGAVGVFVDGVYRNRSGLALADFYDVARVEVLRGPQSTLFGKNTSAGAISIISNKPSNELEGFISGSVGNLSSSKIDGWVNVPIVKDKVLTRFSGGYFKRDGFIEEVNTGATINNKDRWYMRGQALFAPTPDIELRIIGDYSHGDERPATALRVVNGPTAPAIQFLAGLGGLQYLTLADPTKRQISLDSAPFNVAYDDWGLSGELNWDLNDAVKLTNILAYRHFKSRSAADIDYTPAAIGFRSQAFEDTVVTEEFRLSGTVDDLGAVKSVDWTVGAYYTNEDIKYDNLLTNQSQTGLYFCLLVPALCPVTGLWVPGTGSTEQFGTKAESYAGFAAVTLNLTDKLSISGGARYNRDSKTGFGRTVNTNDIFAQNFVPGFLGPVRDYTATTKTDAWTGSASVQYLWTPDFQTYVSYAHGYKAGGINLDRTAAGIIPIDPTPLDPTFEPETADSYEIGLKSKWWDNRLAINLTGFTAKYTDFQVLNFDGFAFAISNVAGARTRGFEFETQISPLTGLSFNAGVTYAETRYDDGITLRVRDPLTGLPTTPAQLGGKRLTNAPLWTLVGGSTYEFPIVEDAISGFVHGDIFYGGPRNTASELDPFEHQGGYTLVNARGGVRFSNDAIELSLWCRNCGDKTYFTTIFASVAQSGSYDGFIGAGREWGATLSAKF